MDVIGQVADAANPFLLSLEVIHTVMVKFNAVSSQSRTQSGSGSGSGRKPIFNQGRLYIQSMNFCLQYFKLFYYYMCVSRIMHVCLNSA